MKPFETLTGQKQARNVLSSAVESGRLAHAYIFAGPQGSGRLTAALDLARVMMCSDAPEGFCGTCSHCVQISSFGHPDVRFTVPAKKSDSPEDLAALFKSRTADGATPIRFQGNTYISIEQVRELETRLSKKSFEGKGYVEIVLDAHLMRREAANAMLKTLEEPPLNTLIILITSRLNGLLPTVRSRAHTVRFGRLPARQVQEVLMSRGVPSERAERLSMMADGCPGRALELSLGEEMDSGEAGRIFSLMAGGGLPSMEMAGMASEKARQLGREGLLDLCAGVISIAHDLRRRNQGAFPLVNPDLPDAGKIDDGALAGVIGLMQLCIQRLRGNVSPAMAFSAAVVGSAEAMGKKR